MDMLFDNLDMTIAVDYAVKPHTKQKNKNIFYISHFSTFQTGKILGSFFKIGNLFLDFPTFLKSGPGPVEFEKIAIKPSELGKLYSINVKL